MIHSFICFILCKFCCYSCLQNPILNQIWPYTVNAKIQCTRMKLPTQPAMLAIFKKASILSDEKSVYEQKNEVDWIKNLHVV